MHSHTLYVRHTLWWPLRRKNLLTYHSTDRESVHCQIRLLLRQRKLTSCSRGKPRLFTITSHTAGKWLCRDKDHDSHSRRGSGCGLITAQRAWSRDSSRPMKADWRWTILIRLLTGIAINKFPLRRVFSCCLRYARCTLKSRSSWLVYNTAFIKLR